MRLGQHFMADEKVLKRVVDSAQLRWGDRVLEVGAGMGALTAELVKGCSVTPGKANWRGINSKNRCSIIAVEKDERLFAELKRRFPEVDIIKGDILKIDWPPFDKCVSNLPYAISKKFVLKLLQHNFEIAVLVLQREFAEKLAARPGDKEYGVVSVCAQACCDIELLDRVPKNAFKPQPRVESRIVRLRKRRDLDRNFAIFVTKLFQRRNRMVESRAGSKRVRDLTPVEFLTLYKSNMH